MRTREQITKEELQVMRQNGPDRLNYDMYRLHEIQIELLMDIRDLIGIPLQLLSAFGLLPTAKKPDKATDQKEYDCSKGEHEWNYLDGKPLYCLRCSETHDTVKT